MSHQEILEKAIAKAIEGGWKPIEWERSSSELTAVNALNWYEVDTRTGTEDYWKLFVFNHDFAKALWDGGDYTDVMYDWKRHLQQMVIAPDPVDYLGANLD